MAGQAGGLNVRAIGPDDAGAVASIYAHHVLHGTATFDTEPPTEADWGAKIDHIDARHWPFIIAERQGLIIGYAYATQFRDRAAYAHTCENSIYLAPEAVGGGVGKLLLVALLDKAAQSGFTQMIAVITGESNASVALHAKLGFRHAGRMEKVGLKFGRLLDTIYMQKALAV